MLNAREQKSYLHAENSNSCSIVVCIGHPLVIKLFTHKKKQLSVLFKMYVGSLTIITCARGAKIQFVLDEATENRKLFGKLFLKFDPPHLPP